MTADVADTATPVPLSDIRADDALLDALGGRADRPAPEELVDDDLCALLLAWRYGVDAEPAPVLVDTPCAVVLLEVASAAYRPTLRARIARFCRLTRRTR